ncbi:uncharacterized protein [Zea mays]|uniref:uncharacterized protein n=1 Tax=Zea mays TaxID=4577 RepID=UPI0004DE8899|nr:uncharacterized protein LOC103644312 [Zea mays]|eukprot:XP_008665736.1 uncharacterized protein LOC103644312 [Zea mays]
MRGSNPKPLFISALSLSNSTAPHPPLPRGPRPSRPLSTIVPRERRARSSTVDASPPVACAHGAASALRSVLAASCSSCQQQEMDALLDLQARVGAGGIGFPAADRSYLGRQHIPTKGVVGIDDVDSEAYVSQFFVDGSLFIAGFWKRVRVYDAEKGWKTH